MSWFLFVLANLGGLIIAISLAVGIAWLLELRARAKHEREMAALDECIIAGLQQLSRSLTESFADLEVWLEQPVREACELTDDEEAAWQRIRAEA